MTPQRKILFQRHVSDMIIIVSVCNDKLKILSMAVRSPTNETNIIVDFLSKDDIFMSAPLVDGFVHGLSKSLW